MNANSKRCENAMVYFQPANALPAIYTKEPLTSEVDEPQKFMPEEFDFGEDIGKATIFEVFPPIDAFPVGSIQNLNEIFRSQFLYMTKELNHKFKMKILPSDEFGKDKYEFSSCNYDLVWSFRYPSGEQRVITINAYPRMTFGHETGLMGLFYFDVKPDLSALEKDFGNYRKR